MRHKNLHRWKFECEHDHTSAKDEALSRTRSEMGHIKNSLTMEPSEWAYLSFHDVVTLPLPFVVRGRIHVTVSINIMQLQVV